MAQMSQSEINEISDAFQEAWEDFFGTEMFYVPFDTTTVPSSIYKESKGKKYLWDKKVPFHGTIKEQQLLDVAQPTGKKIVKYFEITYVTKELAEQEILHVDTNDIIQYIDSTGKQMLLEIYDDFQKVQLVNDKIFTKLKVKYNG